MLQRAADAYVGLTDTAGAGAAPLAASCLAAARRCRAGPDRSCATAPVMEYPTSVAGGGLAHGRGHPHVTRWRIRSSPVGAAPGIERHERVGRGRPPARGPGRPRGPRRAQRRRTRHRRRRAAFRDRRRAGRTRRSGTGFDSPTHSWRCGPTIPIAHAALLKAVESSQRPLGLRDEVLAHSVRIGLARRTDDLATSCGHGWRPPDRGPHADRPHRTSRRSRSSRSRRHVCNESHFIAAAARQRLGAARRRRHRPRPGRPTSTGRSSRRRSCATTGRDWHAHSTALLDAAPANRVASRLAEAGRVWAAALAGDVDVQTVERAVRDLAAAGIRGMRVGSPATRPGGPPSTGTRSQLLALARDLHPEEARTDRRGREPHETADDRRDDGLAERAGTRGGPVGAGGQDLRGDRHGHLHLAAHGGASHRAHPEAPRRRPRARSCSRGCVSCSTTRTERISVTRPRIPSSSPSPRIRKPLTPSAPYPKPVLPMQPLSVTPTHSSNPVLPAAPAPMGHRKYGDPHRCRGALNATVFFVGAGIGVGHRTHTSMRRGTDHGEHHNGTARLPDGLAQEPAGRRGLRSRP